MVFDGRRREGDVANFQRYDSRTVVPGYAYCKEDFPLSPEKWCDEQGGFSGHTCKPISRVVHEKFNHPSHYGGDTTYECIKVIEAWGLNFNLGTVLRYIKRNGSKPGESCIDDLKKALWYLDREIKNLEASAKSNV